MQTKESVTHTELLNNVPNPSLCTEEQKNIISLINDTLNKLYRLRRGKLIPNEEDDMVRAILSSTESLVAVNSPERDCCSFSIAKLFARFFPTIQNAHHSTELQDRIEALWSHAFHTFITCWKSEELQQKIPRDLTEMTTEMIESVRMNLYREGN